MSRPERPLVIAHRGSSAQRPENTLAAYELAVVHCADMIEIDLHETRDGAIVITHDGDLAGLGGRGEIADAGVDDVRALDAGGGERVPLLDEVLDRFGERIPFNLEIKWSETHGDYPNVEERALAAVRERGLLEQTLFSSFRDGVLRRLREREPAARLALLLSPRHAERPFERARALAAEAVNPWYGLATPDFVAAAHAEDFAVYPFTVDDEDDLRRHLENGVDGLFTNHPDRMRALLASPWGQNLESERNKV